ncbi:MAG: ATP-binding protein, partial [Acidobacteriota bacterium]
MTRLETLQQNFQTLRMPSAVQVVEETIASAQKENWSLETFLNEILEQEIEGRHIRRTERLKKAAHLPHEKTLATFNQERLPLKRQRLLPQLCTGEFIDRNENLLVFGLPGRGKTHFSAAVGHELVNIGRSVFFT